MYTQIINYFKDSIPLENFKDEYLSLMNRIKGYGEFFENLVNKTIIIKLQEDIKNFTLKVDAANTKQVFNTNISKTKHYYIRIYAFYNKLFIDSLNFIINENPKKFVKIYQEIMNNYDKLENILFDFSLIKKLIYEKEEDYDTINMKFLKYYDDSMKLIKFFNNGIPNCDYIDSKIYYDDIIALIEIYRHRVNVLLTEYKNQ